MIVTRDELIKKIAKKENINVSTVRQILDALEDTAFDCFSHTTPTENVIVKLMNGVNMECTFIPGKDIRKGMFQNTACADRLKVKSCVTRYYNRKLNGYFEK